MDHHFLGQPVLPAVEAMEILARTTKEAYPHLAVDHLTHIRFDKFLPMDPSKAQLEAVVELQPSVDGQCQASLMTRTKAPKAAITRTKVHARLSFDQSRATPTPWPLDVAAAPEGICLSVTPVKIYGELVPFGPAFQNIVSPVHLSPDGVLVRIETPEEAWTGGGNYLGSAYALDAALHGACVWAQHFRGVVAFPTAIGERTIIRPTLPGRIYYGRIRPRMLSDDLLIFDICLLDEQGELCETIQGIHMRDVSGGRLQPPDWIIRKNGFDSLDEIKNNCLDFTVVELDALAPFAAQTLTSLERERYNKIGPRRRPSFLAARLALKRLYRRCRQEDALIPAHSIETVCGNSPLPRCARTDATPDADLQCTVSHDRRLAVAAVDSKPVGIDVESITGKALKSGRIFMGSMERQLVELSDLGARQAALRIWSIKEAATKALGLSMADAWQSVRVTRIGERRSSFVVDGRAMTAHHATVDDHLVSLVVGS